MDRDLVEIRENEWKTKANAKQATLDLSGPVIWAIDPFEHRLGQVQSVQKVLRSMKLDAQAQPVTSTSVVDVSFPLSMKSMRDDFSAALYQSLCGLLKKVSPRKKLEPTILLQTGVSKRNLVKTVLDHAIQKKASLIAVNTHSKTGLNRLGSFSELLIALSPIPVLAVNPKAKVSEKISTILFATEFSPSSREAFQTILAFAKNRKAKIVIYYKLSFPPIPVGAGGVYMNTRLIEEYFQSWHADMLTRAAEWKQVALDQGISCEAIVDTKVGKIEDLIVKQANKQKADLIALATYTGPIAQAILGSTASDILIRANRPVLVIHTK